MDLMKKHKLDENEFNDSFNPLKLSPSEARKLIDRIALDKLPAILEDAVIHHPDVLSAVCALLDHNLTQWKLFIRGLGWDTTTDGLHSFFSIYDELEEAVVIVDKATDKSKGYDFVTFYHIDGALLVIGNHPLNLSNQVPRATAAAGGYSASGMGGHYGGYGGPRSMGLSASSGYQNQHHLPSRASSVPRVPPSSIYLNVPLTIGTCCQTGCWS